MARGSATASRHPAIEKNGEAFEVTAPGVAAPGMVPFERDGRESALSRAVQQIERQFGKGSVMKLEGMNRGPIDGIPTGALSLDLALGGYGVPRGRILEVFGPESSGKTTLNLHVVANVQKAGGGSGVHRRRARARPVVGPQDRREARRAAGQPAGHR